VYGSADIQWSGDDGHIVHHLAFELQKILRGMPDLRSQGVLAIERVAFAVDVVIGAEAQVLLLHTQVFLDLAKRGFLVVHPVAELIESCTGIFTDEGFAADDVTQHVLHPGEFAAVAGQQVVPCMVFEHKIVGKFVSHDIWIYWPALLTGPAKGVNVSRVKLL